GGPAALGVRPQRHALPRQRRTRRRHLGARRAGGRRGRGPPARLRGRRRCPGRLARAGERAARAGVHVPRRGAAMTTETQQAPATPSERTFTWQGVRTVLTLELRQRVRSTRWKVALVVWFAIVGFVAALLPGLVGSSSGGGTWVFGLILLFVLGLGLVVSPTLASTAINGDRVAGTLAI